MSKTSYQLGETIPAHSAIKKLFGDLERVCVLWEDLGDEFAYYVCQQRRVLAITLYQGAARAILRHFAREGDSHE